MAAFEVNSRRRTAPGARSHRRRSSAVRTRQEQRSDTCHARSQARPQIGRAHSDRRRKRRQAAFARRAARLPDCHKIRKEGTRRNFRNGVERIEHRQIMAGYRPVRDLRAEQEISRSGIVCTVPRPICSLAFVVATFRDHGAHFREAGRCHDRGGACRREAMQGNPVQIDLDMVRVLFQIVSGHRPRRPLQGSPGCLRPYRRTPALRTAARM